MDLESKLLTLEDRYEPSIYFQGESECTHSIEKATEFLKTLDWIKDLTEHFTEEKKNNKRIIKETFGSINFKKVCKDYEEALLNKDQETIDIIETDIDYKDLTDFVEKLGLDKLSSTDYRLKNIQAELSKHRLYNESPDTLRSYLRLQNNVFYPLSTIKERLTLAYEALGIDKKAKATDIQNLYEIHKTVRNGTNGFCILKKI